MQPISFLTTELRFSATMLLLLSLGQALFADQPDIVNVPPEGFAAQFNGKDFTGWHTPPLVTEYWSIEDGVLKSPGLIEQWGACLTTKKHYRDFVLLLDFRMPTISDSGINFRRLIPEIPGFGDMEQFNLRSKGGMGHLESYYFLPKVVAEKMGLKEEQKPRVRHIDPEVGVWHTVKLTMIGRTFSAEYDGEVLYDNFQFHDWMMNMEPAPIRLQKHIVVHGDNLGKENPCPIEYRNIFIKELEPAAADGEASPRANASANRKRLDSSPAKSKNWHQWRGPEANGVSRTATPPIEWGEGKNVKWKVAIEGSGSSTPIIWGNKVFSLTAIDTKVVDPSLPSPEDQPERVFGIKYPNTFYQFVVLCLDRDSGQELWRRIAARRVPHEGHHGDNNFASASPTTDGERLYCWFGSAGLFCYDLQGAKIWQRDLGVAYMGASLGEGCSPVLHNGKLVIVRDQERQSTIEVLDARTGESLWKVDRDEPNAWATPIVLQHSGKTQILTAASNFVRSYDLDTGRIIWQCSGLTGNVIPSPVVEGDVVFCMSGYEGYSLLALPLSATGDISGSERIIWSRQRATPYIPSPLLYDGMLYFSQSNQAILSCVDAKTGASIIDATRLSGISNIYASPVGADNRVYVTGRNGTTLVLKRSKKLEVIALNRLDDRINASPALTGNQLFLRGKEFLVLYPAVGSPPFRLLKNSVSCGENQRPVAG